MSSVLPTPLAELKLSVPLSYFTEAFLSSLDNLHSRILKMEIPLTQGIDFTACIEKYYTVHHYIFRLDGYINGWCIIIFRAQYHQWR